METINKISNEEIEIITEQGAKFNVKKSYLLAEKQRIEDLLLEFE